MDNFYIYIYLDPRKYGRYCYDNICFLYEPIYVGKGKNNRYKDINKRTNLFKNKINKIKNSKLKPVIFKLYENLDEKQSFELEIELIQNIGRFNLGTGPLLNMTSGNEGTSGKIILESNIKKSRKDFLEIQKEFEKRDYILLTEKDDYKNSKNTKLKYKCDRGHKGSIRWNDFQQGHGCFLCYKESLSEKTKGENNPMFGKHLTEESKKKISEKGKGNRHNCKLTEEQVIKIKLLLKEGILTQQEIADMFKVDRTTISCIKTGKIWSHIKLGGE